MASLAGGGEGEGQNRPWQTCRGRSQRRGPCVGWLPWLQCAQSALGPNGRHVDKTQTAACRLGNRSLPFTLRLAAVPGAENYSGPSRFVLSPQDPRPSFPAGCASSSFVCLCESA